MSVTVDSTPRRPAARQALLLPAERGLADQDQAAIQAIRRDIIDAGERLRARFPALDRHQDAIGMAIFLISCLGVVANAVLYVEGVLPWWACVPLSAFWMSLLHELEHDLIHFLYFKRRPMPHNLMMAGVWLMRPSTINPWIRRRMHLHHHRVSGTESDLEERAITNGEPWRLRRVFMTADNMLAIYLRPLTMPRTIVAFARSQAGDDPAERRRVRREQRLSYVPLGVLCWASWHAFLVVGIASLLGLVDVSDEAWWTVLQTAVVVWFAPNVLRTFCLHFVSSNMHYFGDVEAGNVLEQTQVWTAWWLAPLHLFCWNFGATHAIHHFVVGDPFYLRQAVMRPAHASMRRHGVRFNDFATFRRANRRGEYAPS